MGSGPQGPGIGASACRLPNSTFPDEHHGRVGMGSNCQTNCLKRQGRPKRRKPCVGLSLIWPPARGGCSTGGLPEGQTQGEGGAVIAGPESSWEESSKKSGLRSPALRLALRLALSCPGRAACKSAHPRINCPSVQTSGGKRRRTKRKVALQAVLLEKGGNAGVLPLAQRAQTTLEF